MHYLQSLFKYQPAQAPIFKYPVLALILLTSCAEQSEIRNERTRSNMAQSSEVANADARGSANEPQNGTESSVESHEEELKTCTNGMAHGTEVVRVMFAGARVDTGQECLSETQTRRCVDGKLTDWSGQYAYTGCEVAPPVSEPTPMPVAPKDCRGNLPHGAEEIRARFALQLVEYGQKCMSEVQRRKCIDGELSNWSGDYMYSSCEIAPSPPASEPGWVSVSVGDAHTCATKTDNTLWCWGWSYNGAADPSMDLRSDYNIYIPKKVRTGIAKPASDFGYHSTCSITMEGKLDCWGWAQNMPISPSGEFEDDTDWTDVAMGLHVCATKSDNSLWCWGWNYSGQAGVGNLDDVLYPTRIGKKTWQSISASTGHTCGVQTDGSMWCWGKNDWGQVEPGGSKSSKTVPFRLDDRNDWVAVSANGVSSCGIRSNGELWCWGRWPSGDNKGNLHRIDGIDYVSVEVGPGGCAIRKDGGLWCWGNNGAASLNDVDVTRPVPVQIMKDKKWREVAMGEFHTCAVDTSHSLWCWGKNKDGQLGAGYVGLYEPILTPVRIP